MIVKLNVLLGDEPLFEVVSSHNFELYARKTLQPDFKKLERSALRQKIDEPLFEVVSSHNFELYARKTLQPDFKKLERSALRQKIVDIYRKQKEELIKYFGKFSGRLVVSCDLWSRFGGGGDERYLCIICYWVNERWSLEKRVIGFEMLYPYEGKDIASRVLKVLDKFNLRGKVASVSFENVTSKVSCMKYLGKKFNPEVVELFAHDRTYANVVDLCAQEIVDQLARFIDPIRELVRWIWLSSDKRKEFRSRCRDVGLKPSLFCRDYIWKNWKSTVENLRDCYRFREVLTKLWNENAGECCLEDHQWDSVNRIIKLVEVFDGVSEKFSWVYEPTCHLIIQDCITIVHTLNVFVTDRQFYSVVRDIRSKWLEYFPEIPTIYGVATILDPRFKVEGLRQFLVYYYDSLDVNYNVDEKVAECKNAVEQLCAYYAPAHDCETKTTTSVGEEGNKFNVIRSVLKRKRVGYHHQEKSWELGEYLFFHFDIPDDDDEVNYRILQWWDQRKEALPALSKVAKDVLSIPVSTTIPKSRSCPGKRVLDEKRSMLQPGLFQVCICKKDWDLAEQGLQCPDDEDYDPVDVTWDSDLEAED